MARTTASLVVVASALLVLLLALAHGTAAGAGTGAVVVPLSWELGVTGASEEADGFGFGGDAVVRRVLQGPSYISYGALRRDSVRGPPTTTAAPERRATPTPADAPPSRAATAEPGSPLMPVPVDDDEGGSNR